jgi:1-acyl-sn-glycerol-3-phosphate acyltransferase
MFLPVSVDGTENIKPNQSYVFVANHQSMFDVWLVYGWLPVIFKWLMKAELRKVPFVGTGCKAAGHIFVDRRNTVAAMGSLKEVEKQLVNGVCTVIFPEGTRSLNGEVGRFKRGAFQIALDLGLPVIPLSLDGCFEVMPKGKPFVNRHPVHMHIGEPIDLKQFKDADGKPDGNAAIEAVRNAVISGRQK